MHSWADASLSPQGGYSHLISQARGGRQQWEEADGNRRCLQGTAGVWKTRGDKCTPGVSGRSARTQGRQVKIHYTSMS